MEKHMMNGETRSMSALKEKAFEIAYALYNQDVLRSSEYEAIRDGLDEIEALKVRDDELEKLWAQFGDIPIDPDTECIAEQFLGWESGSKREISWKWFDERHSKGVAYLMYKDGVDRMVDIARLYYLKQLCPECDSEGCVYRPFSGNPAAVCVMDQWSSEEFMMLLARENNLSETTFIVKEPQGYHLRWFTPGTEVELCGHATLASSFVILNYIEPDSNAVKFNTLSGELTITRSL